MGKEVKKKLRTVSKKDFDMALQAYSDWKKLDEEIRELSGTRGINLPSEITEIIATYPLGLKICVSGTAGDAYDDKIEKTYEIKGSSSSGPNSFSPSEKYDELLYIKLDKSTDTFKLYKTGYSSEKIGDIKVNKEQTLKDQQAEGRRPRFSIQKEIIENDKMQPDYIIDTKDGTIKKLK